LILLFDGRVPDLTLLSDDRLPVFILLFEPEECDSRFTRGCVLRETLLSFDERLRLIAEGRS
jgi:hypothetical protein